MEKGEELGLGLREEENLIYVTHVRPGTPAATTGVKRMDRIISVNGVDATKQNIATLLPHEVREMTSFILVIFRDGELMGTEDLEALEEEADDPSDNGPHWKWYTGIGWGLTHSLELRRELGQGLGVGIRFVEGLVFVTVVGPGSPAAIGGLQETDRLVSVNGVEAIAQLWQGHTLASPKKLQTV